MDDAAAVRTLFDPRLRRLGLLTALAISFVATPAPAVAADACPNAAYRTGPGAQLPECRAWEQVSPVAKGGNEPFDQVSLSPSPGGDQVVFDSFGGVAAGDGLPVGGAFSSVRGATWSTFGTDPPVDPPPVSSAVVTQATLGYSDDRSKAFVFSLRKLTSDAVEGNTNLYVRDTVDRSYTLAASAAGAEAYPDLAFGTGVDGLAASSRDFKSAAFTSSKALVPGALDLGIGNPNLYVAREGRLSLASRDVNGDGLKPNINRHPGSGQRLISDDGRRITFEATNPNTGGSGLFQRVDDSSTVLISRSHVTQENPPVPRPTSGAWASADGRRVTFAGDETLTGDGPGPFYRWDADGDTLHSLLAGIAIPWSSNAGTFSLLHVSPDGRYLWFTLKDVDANGNNVNRLALLDTQERRAVVEATFPYVNFSEPLFDGDDVRFSLDGTKMVGRSPYALTGYDQTNAGCTIYGDSQCREVFAFDAARPDAPAVCVSCGPGGTRSAGEAGLGVAAAGHPLGNVVTDDGRIVFDTPQRLADSDVDGLSDVYQYVPGRGVSLLSSGTGSAAATGAATSASGNDVFFFTANSLVPQDDGDVDIYDARVGGGIASQQIGPRPASSCPGGSCPGSPAAIPGARTPATSSLQAAPAPISFSVSRVSSAARRTAASTGRLRVGVKVGAAGKLSARVSARLRKKSETIGRTAGVARKAGRLTLTLKLSAAARRALLRDRRLTIALSVSYSRAAKPAAQSFTLVAPRARKATKGGAR